MMANMAKTKTLRLRDDQADWLANMKATSGLRSENQVMEFLIDQAIKAGWLPGGGGGWISGPSMDVPR